MPLSTPPDSCPMPSPEAAAIARDACLDDLIAASREAAELVIGLHAAERVLATVDGDVAQDELAERLSVLGHAASALALLLDILDAYPTEDG